MNDYKNVNLGSAGSRGANTYITPSNGSRRQMTTAGTYYNWNGTVSYYIEPGRAGSAGSAGSADEATGVFLVAE